jgi:hypothetical protein
MKGPDIAKSVRDFKKELRDAQLWLETYAASASLTEAEINAVQSVSAYIRRAFAYCGAPKIERKELERLRAKVERACWTLDQKWRQSGRRLQ